MAPRPPPASLATASAFTSPTNTARATTPYMATRATTSRAVMAPRPRFAFGLAAFLPAADAVARRRGGGPSLRLRPRRRRPRRRWSRPIDCDPSPRWRDAASFTAAETVSRRRGGSLPRRSRPKRWPSRPSLRPSINGRRRPSQHLRGAPLWERHAVLRGRGPIFRRPTHGRTPPRPLRPRPRRPRRPRPREVWHAAAAGAVATSHRRPERQKVE